MNPLDLLQLFAGELALFAAIGFAIFALDDLAVDIFYFLRTGWRRLSVYRRHERASADRFPAPARPGWLAVFVPAWDESAVIGQMLRTALTRWTEPSVRIFVGIYPNDPATAAVLATIEDPRLVTITMPHAGPTTKADCLNRLYAALEAEEARRNRLAKAVILHDAEDVVHRYELRLFDRLIEKAGAVQLPVVPLPHHRSTWVSGHYCDEFAESHGKELVVREAVGAAVPLAGVGCAIRRDEIAAIASFQDGRPFDADSLTEDYELGLKLGRRQAPAILARVPVAPGSREYVASQGYFPGTLDTAVRQKSRWICGIALAGWERTGWRGGWGERWFRMRDRRGPLAALLLACGYTAAMAWMLLGACSLLFGTPLATPGPLLAVMLQFNAVMLLWRIIMRAAFTTRTYGWVEGMRSVPRMVVANTIAILASFRALSQHIVHVTPAWDKTAHSFPEGVTS